MLGAVTVEDVLGEPQLRIDLPLMRLGDRIVLKAVLHRMKGGRTEELRLDGEFRVTSVVVDARGQARQILHVASVGITPTWRSIKNQPSRFPLERPQKAANH